MILDLSSFLVKNSFGLKMKKGFRNLCSGESSTSIVEQRRLSSSQPTLEEMIMQLEMEEKIMQRRKGVVEQHRMSCVSSCDILRSARNAVLNQYPRFSLDGKDAMYRSSFTRNCGGEVERDKMRRLPSVIGGESVIWCKPGVVGKLMGLDAMPIPLNSANYRRGRLSAIINRHHDTTAERRRRRRGVVGSCSRAGYCLVKPLELDIPNAQTATRRFL
ncbi:hypothetical protein C2S52_015943 [Perilla frutescens var. hirtella]|uniref:DUF3741 domain-containing protein n=1 Tax=Perilla frutescens var. hirtella TaxID=608512 RepID=A0AAD4JRH3_PERFH|nr:hypothetical protein C2S52_015943 [Perilla frutescens var. hirtella]KAH6815270.1 hypothetical protein C2S51_020090 [Perilla frutescens var. frutescens]KAH6837825.1 hypothetical protein C2S53_000543 [Perilla frutescens var. hirtella]